jgi:hypothetical protein
MSVHAMEPGPSTRKGTHRKNSGDANMITTRPILGAQVSLDAVVARFNIERFCKIFSGESDETKRHMLVRLIAEEKAKLCALVASPAMQ